MTIIDMIIIAITLLLAVKGFFNGFVKEVFGLIGIIGGVYLAGFYYHQAGVYINENLMTIPNKSAIDLVGFVSVFLIFWIFCIFLGFLFGKILKISAMGFLDKLLGFFFGGVKFFLIISIIVSSLYKIDFIKKEMDKFEKKSVLLPVMLKVGEKVIHFSPEKLNIQNMKKNIEKRIQNETKDINISKLNLNEINKTLKNVKIPLNNLKGD